MELNKSYLAIEKHKTNKKKDQIQLYMDVHTSVCTSICELRLFRQLKMLFFPH